MGVHKEVWTGEVLRKFRKDTGFLSSIPDRSALVKNKTIHLVDLGVDPEVLLNNTQYPIDTVQANDADVVIALERLDTKNTSIQSEYLRGLSYDVLVEYASTHGEVLQEKAGDRTLWNIAPASNATLTPVIKTTGASNGEAQPRKRLTKADILRLKKIFDLNNVPRNGRVLVLCPDHVADVLDFDEKFASQYMNIREGEILKLYGFQVFEYAGNPIYTEATGAKKAFGTAFVASTDSYASVAYYSQRVFKAMDVPEMFHKFAEDDPSLRASVIGFRHWFIGMPKKLDSQAVIIGSAI